MALKDGDEKTSWHAVNAHRTIDEVHQEIQSIVDNITASVGDKPILQMF